MNILKALEGLSGEKPAESRNKEPAENEIKQPAPLPQAPEIGNVMAGVLERHERISNRVRANTPRKN